MVRAGALRRPGLILGAFAALYAVMRSFSEFFREPDQQLGFLWGGMTMGMLLSVPLFIAGVLLIAFALRRQPAYP
jgi:phosphatidylglycerol:prolipoprotein diacylglycerol transferase